MATPDIVGFRCVENECCFENVYDDADACKNACVVYDCVGGAGRARNTNPTKITEGMSIDNFLAATGYPDGKLVITIKMKVPKKYYCEPPAEYGWTAAIVFPAWDSKGVQAYAPQIQFKLVATNNEGWKMQTRYDYDPGDWVVDPPAAAPRSSPLEDVSPGEIILCTLTYWFDNDKSMEVAMRSSAQSTGLSIEPPKISKDGSSIGWTQWFLYQKQAEAWTHQPFEWSAYIGSNSKPPPAIAGGCTLGLEPAAWQKVPCEQAGCLWTDAGGCTDPLPPTCPFPPAAFEATITQPESGPGVDFEFFGDDELANKCVVLTDNLPSPPMDCVGGRGRLSTSDPIRATAPQKIDQLLAQAYIATKVEMTFKVKVPNQYHCSPSGEYSWNAGIEFFSQTDASRSVLAQIKCMLVASDNKGWKMQSQYVSHAGTEEEAVQTSEPLGVSADEIVQCTITYWYHYSFKSKGVLEVVMATPSQHTDLFLAIAPETEDGQHLDWTSWFIRQKEQSTTFQWGAYITSDYTPSPPPNPPCSKIPAKQRCEETGCLWTDGSPRGKCTNHPPPTCPFPPGTFSKPSISQPAAGPGIPFEFNTPLPDILYGDCIVFADLPNQE